MMDHRITRKPSWRRSWKIHGFAAFASMPTRGLGRALNAGLDASSGGLIAYLPSDDVWYRDRLASLVARADQPARPSSSPTLEFAIITIGRLRARSTGEPLQLVQTMHRRTRDRWVERSEAHD